MNDEFCIAYGENFSDGTTVCVGKEKEIKPFGEYRTRRLVLEALDEMENLNPDEILVARTTTPAWTPLFTRISGLITDLGGPLAHGSIVAREVGIPAVMGTGNATQKIRSGQRVTILGSEGKVILS